MDEISSNPNHDTIRALYKKLAPPLVTLLNSEPEIQYVALRNINLIVQKRPEILVNEIKVFFCKYNDPIYVKMEKLDIIIRLVKEKTIDQVLLELKEYATEVDVEFVRRSLRAIGRCAIKLDRSAERCIAVLLELIQTKVNYVVQEGIIVIKDIFRRYPNKYEAIIATLCENLEDLDEPEAKASMIWIIGEYSDRIDNSDELLESFLESFKDETAQVQQQLLTAVVKLFLKQPDNTQELVQRVLNMATEESDNPDLRDRGYIYWRLLSSDPEAARAVVLSAKPEIGDDTFTLDAALLEDLITQIATLASIYHKPPEAFIMKSTTQATDDDEYDAEGYEENQGVSSQGPGTSGGATSSSSGGGGDLLDLMDDAPPMQQSTSSTSNVKKVPILTPENGKGLGINGAMVNQGGKISLLIDVTYTGSNATQALAFNLNKNGWGLAPLSPQVPLPQAISHGSSCSTQIDLKVDTPPAGVDAGPTVQAAIKNMTTGEVCYFHVPISIESLFAAGAAVDAPTFAGQWKSMGEANEANVIVNNVTSTDPAAVKVKFAAYNLAFIAERQIPGTDQTAVYFAAKTAFPAVAYLVEIKFKAGANMAKVTVKSPTSAMSDVVKSAVAKIIAA